MAVKMGRRVATHRESGMQQHSSVAAPPSGLPSTTLPLTISKNIPCSLQAWAGCANDLQGPCERPSLPFGCLEGGLATLGCELRIQEHRRVREGGVGVSLTASLRLGETSHTG